MTEPLIAAKAPARLTLEAGTYYWCACGRSKKQPFCDGSHQGTGLEPLAFEVTQQQEVVLCLCKHSKTPPYCDGSHKSL